MVISIPVPGPGRQLLPGWAQRFMTPAADRSCGNRPESMVGAATRPSPRRPLVSRRESR